jgi:hypothetical protein
MQAIECCFDSPMERQQKHFLVIEKLWLSKRCKIPAVGFLTRANFLT